MTYQYVNPREKGFRRVKISRADHRRIFPKRVRNWATKYEYYLRDVEFQMHRFPSTLFVVLCLATFPLMLLIHGFANRDLWKEYRSLLQPKKYGRFSADGVWASNNAFPEILKAVKP